MSGVAGGGPRSDLDVSRLRAITFDAAGTLIDVAEPVGATYARLAHDAGFTVEADAMETGFRAAFAAAPPLAPPPGHAGSLDAFERDWWRDVVAGSLAHALGDPSLHAVATGGAAMRAFDGFFAAAFAHYASPAAWCLVPDAAHVLATLRARGLALAVLSNFDRRLHGVLAGLRLTDALSAVVASTECGGAKPHRAPFDVARARLGGVDGTALPPGACLHVGDSLREDVGGALAAGWHAVWVDRTGDGSTVPPAPAIRITRLAELPDLPLVAQSAGS